MADRVQFEYNLNISRTKKLFGEKMKNSRHKICFNESYLKMMKNSFYFILKALFVLKYSKTAWIEG